MSKPTYEELVHHCQILKAQLGTFEGTQQLYQNGQRQLTRLLNNLPGVAYRCSLDDNLRPTLEFVSRGSIELFGVAPEYFTDQHTNVMETLAHPDDLAFMHREQQAAIVGRRPYKLHYRVRLDDDSRKWVWDQGECVYDEFDRPTHLEGIMIDISAQKLREYELVQENQKLQGSLGDRYRFGSIIGKSQGMREVFKLILKASKSDANVIILGETGTGKDLVAQTIHEQAGSHGPYVPVNCGAIPANLMESEFFGHKKGSFPAQYVTVRAILPQLTAVLCFSTKSVRSTIHFRSNCCARLRASCIPLWAATRLVHQIFDLSPLPTVT